MSNFNMSSMPTNGLPFNFNGQPGQINPYGNTSLLSNSPYDNYMGRGNNSQNNLQSQFLKCRPVSSKEEARASQIDLDGSLWVFTDVGNGKIYTKQINNDGTASFKTYAVAEDETPYTEGNFVTKNEFNKVIQSLLMTINGLSSSLSGSNEDKDKKSQTINEINKQIPLNF